MIARLVPDRSDRPRYVRFVRYERRGDRVTPVRVLRDANGTSLTEVPWRKLERERGPAEPERSSAWDVERLAAAAAHVCTPTEGYSCWT